MKRSEAEEKIVCPKRRAKLALVPNAPGTCSIIFHIVLSHCLFIFNFPKKKQKNRGQIKWEKREAEIEESQTLVFDSYGEVIGREKWKKRGKRTEWLRKNQTMENTDVFQLEREKLSFLQMVFPVWFSYFRFPGFSVTHSFDISSLFHSFLNLTITIFFPIKIGGKAEFIIIKLNLMLTKLSSLIWAIQSWLVARPDNSNPTKAIDREMELIPFGVDFIFFIT